MKKSKKSLKLTHIMVKSFYLVVVLVVVLSLLFYKENLFLDELLRMYFIPLYISLPIGVAALICLDRLLANLKKDIVFCTKNVQHLNHLSICCFVAAAIALLTFVVIIIFWFYVGDWEAFFSTVLTIPFFIMGIGEIFVGLVVRVVKNSFESAIEIKDENDLTI